MASHIKKEPGLSAVKAEEVSKVAPTPKRAKTLDFGLASMWEDCKVVRDLLRDNKRLIRWMSETQVNVITLETLGLNAVVMGKVAAKKVPLLLNPSLLLNVSQSHHCILNSWCSPAHCMYCSGNMMSWAKFAKYVDFSVLHEYKS